MTGDPSGTCSADFSGTPPSAAAPPGDAVIVVQGVSFAYNGQPVLENVDLTVTAGDFMAMIGPNGGGKTTLLKLMLGLLAPGSGTIRIFGQAPERVSHRIGYVPQDVHVNTDFPISALDVVLMGRLKPGRGWSRPARGDRVAAHESLNRLGMGAFCDRRIGALSGGQRQRVFIARALVCQPDILFLDEPTASIDPQGQTDFYQLLRELNQRITIVLVSHDLLTVSSYVKSVACVNRGVHHHTEAEVTGEMMDMYRCPVEIIAHGLPHRVFKEH